MKKFTHHDYKIIKTKTTNYRDIKIQNLQLTHRLFDGTWSCKLKKSLVIKKQAVGVLLYDIILDQVILIEQFRHGALKINKKKPWLIEIVAGVVEQGLNKIETAFKEAEEEAGARIIHLIPITDYLTSPATTNELMNLYCGLININEINNLKIFGNKTENEDILVHKINLKDAILMINQGTINNAATIISIQWLFINKNNLEALKKSNITSS